MSSQIVLRSSTMNKRRRQPSLSTSSSSSSSFAEVAGGTTAECAAVCCCCPCGLMNLLVLAIYKIPVALCKKALRKRRKQVLIQKGLLPKRENSKYKFGCDDFELHIHPVVDFQSCFSDESEKKVMEFEKEMWERFYSTGFWRSPSQREALLKGKHLID